jgi:diguanylate cyclase (GGDEF)-like protein
VQQRELREANALLRTQATRDTLTGLRNLRALRERMSEEIERARRHKEPLSLLLLDVDRFKQYNDTFGHPAGDDVLCKVARVMEDQARGTDFVARYGGEEFVILLPNTTVEAARVAAERVRAAIECASWTQRPVTASIGVATTDASDAEAAVLLAQADTALYAAKAQGRNRTAHVQDLPQG